MAPAAASPASRRNPNGRCRRSRPRRAPVRARAAATGAPHAAAAAPARCTRRAALQLGRLLHGAARLRARVWGNQVCLHATGAAPGVHVTNTSMLSATGGYTCREACRLGRAGLDGAAKRRAGPRLRALAPQLGRGRAGAAVVQRAEGRVQRRHRLDAQQVPRALQPLRLGLGYMVRSESCKPARPARPQARGAQPRPCVPRPRSGRRAAGPGRERGWAGVRAILSALFPVYGLAASAP